jgi:hypothetical protein
MAIIHETSIQSVMNQVLLIVHNIFSGMGGVMNIAPLQLKGPTSSQLALMFIEGNPTPQGSGSSTRTKSTGMGRTSLLQFGLPNPDKASFFSPPNFVVASKAFMMDVDDVARTIDDHAAG